MRAQSFDGLPFIFVPAHTGLCVIGAATLADILMVEASGVVNARDPKSYMEVSYESCSYWSNRQRRFQDHG
jgi:ABC-type hemin transport system substrate-binding protein